MKVLLTGANGFLGMRLARRLAESGTHVRALVRNTAGLPELAHPNIELFQGAFTDPKSLAAAMVGIQQVYHLAAISTDWAPDLGDFYRVNVLGGIQLIEAAREAGVEKIVITSTAGAVGPPDPKHVYPVTEDHVRTVRFFTDYECSKIILEERVQHYVREGMHIVIASPTRVYGPGPIARKNGYLILIHSYLHKALAPYPAFKTQLGNLAYIDDVVEGHLLAMEKGRSGERYFLGGHNVTFQDLFDTLKTLTGKNGRPIAIPVGLFKFWAWVNRWQSKWFGSTPMVTREWIYKSTFSWPVSCDKAIRELGYAPRSFQDAVKLTVEFVDEEVRAGRA